MLVKEDQITAKSRIKEENAVNYRGDVWAACLCWDSIVVAAGGKPRKESHEMHARTRSKKQPSRQKGSVGEPNG